RSGISDLPFKISAEPPIAQAEAAMEKRCGMITDDPRRVDVVLHSETIAGRARTVNTVERKRPRLDRRNADAALHAGHLFGVQAFLAINDGDQHNSLGQLGRLFD